MTAISSNTVESEKTEDLGAPAYLMATLELSDIDAYMTKYGQPVFPAIVDAGGEVLAATPTVDVLEGNYSANWTVIIRFPSMEAIQTFYHSDDYRPFIPIRQALSNPESSTLLALPGFSGLPG
ncbi:hypothetical protein C1752_00010 [Acaryochloris thomasi RCC1774]|uniref:DUF1330 domain-containing protein n=1 Tax=Acaryochloris thomasi RCC1774 TaxID=1764569 RepID=A0A2W1JQ16_9CYAN|nr:DUF1330 domain-containing protein [Acaryochloris thomasi]PZD75438.1 hypothetical protein C1752_00010 [Acaryochloris thomasi RCC1774]